MSGAPSKARTYLQLARVSNLPTVWTNVLAGMTISGVSPVAASPYLRLAAGVSLLYMGGMFLNDAFDAPFDARARPGAPILAGEATRGEAFAVGGGLLLLGELTIMAGPSPVSAAIWGAVLVVAIVYYDFHHKQNPAGVWMMGLCRGLVYCVVAVASARTVSGPVLSAAALLALYVVVLTRIAKRVGPKGGGIVPRLVAGISLVDAAVIASTGSIGLAAVAATGFVATLWMQRIVRGA